MKQQKILIAFGLFDIGCLPGVLKKQIVEAEKLKAACDGKIAPDQVKNIEVFIGQMTRCLAAVVDGRGAQ